MAKDKDFQDFVFFSYDLTGRVQATKSANLFERVAKKIASKNEELTLFNNLCFTSMDEFKQYLTSAFLKRNLYKNKFPNLEGLQNANEIIISAARKVVVENKFESKVMFRPLSCWEQFLLLASNCTIWCAGYSDPDDCYWPCFYSASAYWSICQLFEP